MSTTNSPVDLTGSVALITGAGRGQGRSHAVALAQAGADVVICDITQQDPDMPIPTSQAGDLEETEKLVQATGRKCLAQVVDVRDRPAMRQLVSDAVDVFGRIDILVANAGVISASPIETFDDHEWDVVIDTNLTGVYNSIRAVAPQMVKQRYGRIIATASGFGRHGNRQTSHYVASKWGVIGLIKSVAIDLGSYGITANAICPGQVDTPIIRNEYVRRLWNPHLTNPTDEDVDAIARQQSPMGVAAVDAEDISNAVLYLVSPGARYVSGGTLDVGAGYAAAHT